MNRIFLTYDSARNVVNKLGLNSVLDWKNYCRKGYRPVNIPADPAWYYQDMGWLGWADFLGNIKLHRKNGFISFLEARKYARALNLKSNKEWIKYIKLGKQGNLPIPLHPDVVYRNNGWLSWPDWLNNGRTSKPKAIKVIAPDIKMDQPKFEKSDIERIRKLYLIDGRSVRFICKEYHVGLDKLRILFRDNNIQTRKNWEGGIKTLIKYAKDQKSPYDTPDITTKIIRMYVEENKSVSFIQNALTIGNPRVVVKILAKNGIALVNKPMTFRKLKSKNGRILTNWKWHKEIENEIATLYGTTGENIYSLSKKYNTNKQQILNILKKKGVKTNQSIKLKITLNQPEQRKRKSAIAKHFGHLNREKSKERMLAYYKIKENRDKLTEIMRRKSLDPEYRKTRAYGGRASVKKQMETGKFGSKVEDAFGNILKEMKINYIHQFHYKYFYFDFCIPEVKLLVEIDGDYWHANPKLYSHKKLTLVQQRNVKHDVHKDRVVAEKGDYRLVRFWEDDIKNKPDTIKGILNKLINKK